ncbi:MAG: SRPBCC family protein [Actinomycetota bacterium]
MKINNEFTVGVPVETAWEGLLDLERIAPCLPGAAIQESEGDRRYKGTMKVKIGPITANYRGTVEIKEADEANRRAVIRATGRDARGQGTASATITSTLEGQGETTKVSVETDMHLTGRAAQFGRGIAQDVAAKMLQQFADCLEEELAGQRGRVAETAGTSSGAEASGDGAREGEPPPVTPVGGTGTLGRVVSAEPGTPVAGTGSVEGTVVSGGGPSEPAAAAARTAGEEQPGAGTPPRREEPEAFDLGAASQEAILKRAAPVLAGAGLLLFIVWLIRRR